MQKIIFASYITFVTMPRFINPFTDFGFKKIFGQEVNKDLLMDFLNNLLVGERHILDIEFMDKEHGEHRQMTAP